MRYIRARAKIELRDAWVGLFWDRRRDGLHLYVCPLPFLLLHVVVLAEPHARRCDEEGCDAPAARDVDGVEYDVCREHALEVGFLACEGCDRVFDPAHEAGYSTDEDGVAVCAACCAEMRADRAGLHLVRGSR